MTSRLSFKHYIVLSWNIPIPQFSKKIGVLGNYCYGHFRLLRNALGERFDKKCMIEHGVYFGRRVLEEECLYPDISTIYTYSPYRKEVLENHFGNTFNKTIVPVGPYLMYSAHQLSEHELKKLKGKMGKMLLIFPSHSSLQLMGVFDYDSWLAEIDKRSQGYNTVIICLFWADIYLGHYKRYKNKGYKLACCGNRFDQLFLSRLKDLISLADMTMSNDLGTHIGYCIAMGKPHYVFRQNVVINTINNNSMPNNIKWDVWEKEKVAILGLFSQFEERITEEQRRLVDYYWGNSCLV